MQCIPFRKTQTTVCYFAVQGLLNVTDGSSYHSSSNGIEAVKVWQVNVTVHIKACACIYHGIWMYFSCMCSWYVYVVIRCSILCICA